VATAAWNRLLLRQIRKIAAASTAPRTKPPTTAPAIIPPEGDFDEEAVVEEVEEVVDVEGRDDVEEGKTVLVA
jgi:hypothetical protein